jgi:hypothetical protein
MKKIFFAVSLLLVSVFAMAQCTITGPSGPYQVGQSYTFSVSQTAQCADCYDWDVSGPVSITSSDQNQSVTIQVTGNGSFSLCVNYIDEEGCHSCCFNGTAGIACCIPYLDSYFICGGWREYGGHGAIYIGYDEACDRSTISSIDWDVNGAVFINGTLTGLSSGTTYGAGSPGNIASYGCDEGMHIFVTATIHFNNGCPDVTITQDITPSYRAASPTAPVVSVFPNPVVSELSVKMQSGQSLQKTRIILVDMSTGVEVYNTIVPLSENNYSTNIRIPSAYRNKNLVLIILDKNKITYTKTIRVQP